MSDMDVDTAPVHGAEGMKDGGASLSPATAPAERTPKGKGEGDRNIMLHPVCQHYRAGLRVNGGLINILGRVFFPIPRQPESFLSIILLIE